MLAISFVAGASDHVRPEFDLTKYRYQGEKKSLFADSRSLKVADINYQMSTLYSGAKSKYYEGNPTPAFSLGPNDILGTLDGPNGELWYYTANFEYEEIPPHDDIIYTDYILQKYRFDIFDSKMNAVGSIEDEMDYEENEVRVVNCDLLPFVSRNFFNTDDKTEVVVSMTVNAEVGYNHYRSLVYALGAEKTDGMDTPVMSFDRLVGDVAEAPSSDSSENYYMTFMEDIEPTSEEADEMTFWEYLCGMKIRLSIYKKAVNADGPQLVYTREVPLCQMQGDQESSPLMFTVNHDGYLYYVLPYYAEPFFNEYNDPISEETTMRTPNELKVEFLRMKDDELNLQYTTSIPVEKVADETAIASFYGIGNLRYRDDVWFNGYNTPADRAALIVTRQDYFPSSDGYLNSYYVYDHEGNRIRTLCEGAERSLALADIDGFEPQQLFFIRDEYGYDFSFVNLFSGSRVLRLSNYYEIDPKEDPELLTANIERCPDAESGYVYVDELRTPRVIMSEPDEDGNSEELDNRMRFMWINKDGSFRKIDEVSMGKNVRYAQSYIDLKALDPTFYNPDATPEYMMLIKRAISPTENIEELMIGQAVSPETPDGYTLLLLGPEEGKGILNGIFADFFSENPSIMVSYLDQSGSRSKFTTDFYTLPLEKSGAGVSTPVSKPASSNIVVENGLVKADGFIRIYNASGALVASGDKAIDLRNLSAGVYIATAEGTSRKILVR